jgi:uncharacterized protein with HEPN domain
MKTGERDYRDFLEDMAQYAEKGMHIVEDLDYDAFQGNEEKVLAAITKKLYGKHCRRICHHCSNR